MPKFANHEPIIAQARVRIVDLPSVSAEFVSPERVITDAVRHFVTSIRQPEVAQALESRAEDLYAASQALRKLTQAAEELNHPVMDLLSLGRCFRGLLAAHQATWRTAFRSSVEGPFVGSVRDSFADFWRTVFLPVLLDRSIRSAGVVKFSGFDWVRIFGEPRQKSKSCRKCCCDGCCSAPHRLQGPIDFHFIMSLLPPPVLRDPAPGMHLGDHLPTAPRAEQTRRHVYDYSPIGDKDLYVNIDAMRDAVASVEYMIKLVSSSIAFIENNKWVSRDYAYGLLDRHRISTGAFHRALNPIYGVTLSSLVKARARHRRAQQQGQAESQPVRTKKNTARRRKRARPAAKRRRSARREVTTP